MADVAETLIEKKRDEPWQIREALIVIPFLASALALTWELGFFARIRGGAFGLFNIAEHLTFALQALPFALAMTTIGVVGFISQGYEGYRAYRGGSRIVYLIGRVVEGLIGGSLLAVFVWFYLADMDLDDIALAAVTVLSLSVVHAPRKLLMNPVVIFGGILFIFFVAFAVGFVSARSQIRSSSPLNLIKFGEKGKETETEMKVRILRTGERGVLYYDPTSLTFGLLPWDYVKRVNWAISPLWNR